MDQRSRGLASVTGRKKLMSDEDTRQSMITAAKMLIDEEDGLTVSLDHLGFEQVIGAARVSRSAVYRLWPTKDAFFADVTLELAASNHPGTAAYGRGTIELATAIVAEGADLLVTEAGRRRLFIEACRQGAHENYEYIRNSKEWKTHVALCATLASLEEGDLRGRLLKNLSSAESFFVSEMSSFYGTMMKILGFRLHNTAPHAFGILATLGGAVVEGLALVEETSEIANAATFVTDPFNTGIDQEWSMASLGFSIMILGLGDFIPQEEYDLESARSLLRAMTEPGPPPMS